MSNIIKMEGGEKSWRPSRRMILIGLIVVSLLVLGLYVAFSDATRNKLTDRYQTLTDPAKGVCSDDATLIDEYNAAARGLDPKPFASLSGKIATLPAAKEDASCTYMHIVYETRYGDIYAAKKLLGELRELEKSRKKISRSIDDGIDRQKMYKDIDAVDEKSTEVDG